MRNPSVAVMETVVAGPGRMQNFFLTLQYTDGIYRKSWSILAEDKGNLQALLTE
jgi:hypothetical protein